jgi:hypothetical protein
MFHVYAQINHNFRLLAGVLFAMLAPYYLFSQDAAAPYKIVVSKHIQAPPEGAVTPDGTVTPDGIRWSVTQDVVTPAGKHFKTMKGLKPPQEVIVDTDGTRLLVTSDVINPDGSRSQTMKGLPPQKAGETTKLYMLTLNGGYDAPALLRADGQGNYEMVREIDTSSRVPGYIVLEDQDLGMLVVTTELFPNEFHIVDIKSPSKDWIVSIKSGEPEISQLDVLNFVRVSSNGAATLALITPKDALAISLEETSPSVSVLPVSALEGLRVGGALGGNPEQFDSKTVDGKQQLDYTPHSGRFPSGLPRPPRGMGSKEGTSFLLFAASDAVVVAGPIETAGYLEVYSRRDKQWRRFPAPFTFEGVRVFGSWIAITSAKPKQGLPKGPFINSADIERLSSSPGSEKRKTEFVYRQTTVDDAFASSGTYYPGDLAVINGLTGQTFHIHTGQGDSEVLLVDQTSIFYRVNDQIFQSEMKGGAVSEPVKVVEGPEIVQVHWAFRPR